MCEEAPGAYRPNGKQSRALSSHDIIIIIVIIVITGDAFNAISHDGVHFPAESERRSDEAVTTGTSNIKEPQGLFTAAFHPGSRSHDSSARSCNVIEEKLSAIKRREINPQQMTGSLTTIPQKRKPAVVKTLRSDLKPPFLMNQAAAREQNEAETQTSSHVDLQQERQSSKTKTREERKTESKEGREERPTSGKRGNETKQSLLHEKQIVSTFLQHHLRVQTTEELLKVF